MASGFVEGLSLTDEARLADVNLVRYAFLCRSNPTNVVTFVTTDSFHM